MRYLALAVLVLCPALMPAQTPAVAAASTPPAATAVTPDTPLSSDQTTMRVDVKLVNVFVTVTDKTGAPVASLTKDNFHLSEDGVPQSIAVFNRESELPLSIVLAIDASLSTKKDLKLELQAARKFAREILRPQDALAVYQFSEIVEELGHFTSDLRQIDDAIGRVHVRSATAMYDALLLGADALMNRQGRKVMVIITDGGDTVSTTTYAQALREAQQAEAIVYSIIVVPIEASAGRDTGGEHALIQISHDTGGKYYYASGLDQLDRAFRQISEELRTQYLLAYYPSRRLSDSDFRRITVQVSGADEDMKARYRAGYYTSKSK
jgi:Ca-activated chloride channel family protein